MEIAAIQTWIATTSDGVISSTPVAAHDNRLPPLRKGRDWSGLVERVASGDHAALAELYDATSPIVYGLALRILDDRNTAEDAVIEVYAQAWREAKHFDPARATPCAWLLMLTRSRAIDLRRAHRRDETTDPLESAADVPSNLPNPEDANADAERHRFVRQALTSLGKEQREAIELAYFSGLSHTEISMKLGQPLGSIKTRIRLGMMQLRGLLVHLAPAVLPVSKEST